MGQSGSKGWEEWGESGVRDGRGGGRVEGEGWEGWGRAGGGMGRVGGKWGQGMDVPLCFLDLCKGQVAAEDTEVNSTVG